MLESRSQQCYRICLGVSLGAFFSLVKPQWKDSVPKIKDTTSLKVPVWLSLKFRENAIDLAKASDTCQNFGEAKGVSLSLPACIFALSQAGLPFCLAWLGLQLEACRRETSSTRESIFFLFFFFSFSFPSLLFKGQLQLHPRRCQGGQTPPSSPQRHRPPPPPPPPPHTHTHTAPPAAGARGGGVGGRGHTRAHTHTHAWRTAGPRGPPRGKGRPGREPPQPPPPPPPPGTRPHRPLSPPPGRNHRRGARGPRPPTAPQPLPEEEKEDGGPGRDKKGREIWVSPSFSARAVWRSTARAKRSAAPRQAAAQLPAWGKGEPGQPGAAAAPAAASRRAVIALPQPVRVRRVSGRAAARARRSSGRGGAGRGGKGGAGTPQRAASPDACVTGERGREGEEEKEEVAGGGGGRGEEGLASAARAREDIPRERAHTYTEARTCAQGAGLPGKGGSRCHYKCGQAAPFLLSGAESLGRGSCSVCFMFWCLFFKNTALGLLQVLTVRGGVLPPL